LLQAAESARAARGDTAMLVVCPAAWTSKFDLLAAAGYALAMTWIIKQKHGARRSTRNAPAQAFGVGQPASAIYQSTPHPRNCRLTFVTKIRRSKGFVYSSLASCLPGLGA
jgi:hypothetical protein